MLSLVLFKPEQDSEAATVVRAEALAPVWRKITLLNPAISLIAGFRTLFGGADASAAVGLATVFAFLALGLAAALWLAFRAGWRVRS